MRHLELMTCVVAGLFTRPENYAELNKRLEHALDDASDLKPRPRRMSGVLKQRPRPH
jgi:hypothetical protein